MDLSEDKPSRQPNIPASQEIMDELKNDPTYAPFEIPQDVIGVLMTALDRREIGPVGVTFSSGPGEMLSFKAHYGLVTVRKEVSAGRIDWSNSTEVIVTPANGQGVIRFSSSYKTPALIQRSVDYFRQHPDEAGSIAVNLLHTALLSLEQREAQS